MRNQYTSILIITLYSLLFNFSSIADQKEKSRQSYKQATEELPGAIKELTDIIRKENQARRGLSANNLVELNNMRATVALKRKPDGSFCQLDVRGNSKLTPSFVKSAHRNVKIPESDVPICSDNDMKDFQKKVKKLNLKGAKIRKTNVAGFVLGSLAKSVGFGCVFGAGSAWIIDKLADRFKKKKEDKKTEAGSSCIDCSNKKSTEVKEVEGLREITVGSSIGRGIFRAVVGTRTNILNKTKEDIRRYEEIVKANNPHLNKKKLSNKRLLELYEKMATEINKEKIENNTLKKRLVELYKKVATEEINKEKIENNTLKKNSAEANNNKKPNNNKKKVILTKKRLAVGLRREVSFMTMAGSIVCQNGIIYLLSEEKIEDI